MWGVVISQETGNTLHLNSTVYEECLYSDADGSCAFVPYFPAPHSWIGYTYLVKVKVYFILITHVLTQNVHEQKERGVYAR